MGNVFMKKCDDVFETSKKFIDQYKLKKDYDFLIIDFHEKLQVKMLLAISLMVKQLLLLEHILIYLPTMLEY